LHVSSIVMVTIPFSNIAWPSPSSTIPSSCIFQLWGFGWCHPPAPPQVVKEEVIWARYEGKFAL
jgi:hypothetical protein